MSRPLVRPLPADPAAFNATRFGNPDLTLRELFAAQPAHTLDPVSQLLDFPLVGLRIVPVSSVDPDTPLYLPPGVTLGSAASTSPDAPTQDSPEPAMVDGDGAEEPAIGHEHPETLSEREAVLIAHRFEINQVAAYLESGLSVLVQCEKLLVEHLARVMAVRSGKKYRKVEIAAAEPSGPPDPMRGGNRRSLLIEALQQAVTEAIDGQIVVVPHLDLLAGGSDATLTSEARDLTDLLYERSGCIILGFTDPSLTVPDVLAKRFAVRVSMDILPRAITTPASGKTGVKIGTTLVTREEVALFAGFDADRLYQNVAGMNAVRLRNGIRFAYHKHRETPDTTFETLLDELRLFKASTSADAFAVPDTTFDDIGGYAEVKAELQAAIEIVNGSDRIPEDERAHLVPRGFIFYGPPGTGKTLFAKAVAAAMGGNILVVSGPEITDKYVGESERKVRDIFAQARNNAPAVVVFDEFDAIAAQRTGRDDGGSRAGNAIVAQLLTELDGFRPATPVLIIGTTNRIDLIDKALLRPSRFREIGIGLPRLEARRQIAASHAKRSTYDDLSPALLDRLAEATDGMNGDEIGNIFRQARRDELLGSGERPDAYTFGTLVGKILATRQELDIQTARRTVRPADDERLPRRNPGRPDDPAAPRGTTGGPGRR